MKKIIACLVMMSAIVFGLTACKDTNSQVSGENEIQEKVPEYKELTDPRGKTLESTATGEINPQLVETLYETDDVVIADIIPTEMGYAVDPTGMTDSTAGIQQALNDCNKAGGGTVYLPAGNYAISETIRIPAFVTLRGDWQDPDEGTEYGTIISVWMDPEDAEVAGAFKMGASSGVVGLTVYYPLQSLECIMPYPYTFYVDGGRANRILSTIKNVTIINGYRGIGSTYSEKHEMLEIINVKGTYLNCGAVLCNSADVSTVTGFVVNNKYWKEAAADCMNAVAGSAIDAYTKNYTVGMKLSDMEWCVYQDISIDNCSQGIHFAQGVREQCSGSFYNVDITNCTKGVLVDGAKETFGIVFASSHIDGGITNNTKAKVKMSDVEIDGDVVETAEDTIIINDVDLSEVSIDFTKTYTKPKANVVVAELKSGVFVNHSAQLQELLDEVAADGGGVVYVPGGTYYLKDPLTVPAGVELRGNSSVMTRDQVSASGGTVFLCYYGDDATDGVDSQAFITLAGENAGVNGIRIVYPENSPYDEDLNTTYVIRGTAKGVYAVHVMISGAAYGIDFTGCDNHYVEGIISGCYYNDIRVGGTSGVVTRCLHNGTVLSRTRTAGLSNWIAEGDLYDVYFDPLTREYNEYIIVEDAKDQLVYNVFSFGSKTGLVNTNSVNTIVVDIGNDKLGAFTPQFHINGGSLTAVNVLRWNGYSFELEKGDMALYNRAATREVGEENIEKSK